MQAKDCNCRGCFYKCIEMYYTVKKGYVSDYAMRLFGKKLSDMPNFIKTAEGQQSYVGQPQVAKAYFLWKYLTTRYNYGKANIPKKGNGYSTCKVPGGSSSGGNTNNNGGNKEGCNCNGGGCPHCNKKNPFPAKWGKPPSMPYNLVPLPKPFKGVGSPKLAQWIKCKQGGCKGGCPHCK